MKTYINGEFNENVQWIVLDGNKSGELIIDTTVTGETLEELEEKYSVAGIIVSRYDDEDVLIDEWHIKNLVSLSYVRKNDGVYEVHVCFDASKMSVNETEELSESMEDSEMSILELATYCATIEDDITNLNRIVGELRTNNENRCNITDERVNILQNNIFEMSNMVNAFADRIARLENASN